MGDRFDVIEVQIAPPNSVRVLAHDLDAANADAWILMAIARRGVEGSFFKVVPAGSRKETEHG